ncbi:hypothetical protein [Nocardia sp. NPDC052112]|uniref:hypothetical protein n=1 Tax=Nocardia sp. NPDC052112 TaxID=3155646 RepID=UPI00343BB7D5
MHVDLDPVASPSDVDANGDNPPHPHRMALNMMGHNRFHLLCRSIGFGATVTSVTAGVALSTEIRSASRSGMVRVSPWGGYCAIRSQTRIDPVHVAIDTAPRKVMQMPLAVQFLSSRPGTESRSGSPTSAPQSSDSSHESIPRTRSRARRGILLSMALAGGLMLFGPSVSGMTGSLQLPALPTAYTSSFDVAPQSHGHPMLLSCRRFDC